MEQEGELSGIEGRDEDEGLKLTESQKQEILQQIAEAWRKAQPYLEHPEKLLPNQPFPEQFPGGSELKFEVPFGESTAGSYSVMREQPSFGWLGIPKQVLGIHDERIQEMVFAIYNEHGPVELSTFRTDRKDSTDPQRPVREMVHIGLREPDEDRVLQMEHYHQAQQIIEQLSRQGIDQSTVGQILLTVDPEHSVIITPNYLHYRSPEASYQLRIGSFEPGEVSVQTGEINWQPIGNIDLKGESAHETKETTEAEQTPEKLPEEKLAQLKEAAPYVYELALRHGWDPEFNNALEDERLLRFLEATDASEITVAAGATMGSTRFFNPAKEIEIFGNPTGWVGGSTREGVRFSVDQEGLRQYKEGPPTEAPEPFLENWQEITRDLEERCGLIRELHEESQVRQAGIAEINQRLAQLEPEGGNA